MNKYDVLPFLVKFILAICTFTYLSSDWQLVFFFEIWCFPRF